MHSNMKFDVAFEVLSQYNSMVLNQFKGDNQNLLNIQNKLADDREQLLCGNENVIDKIINEYGKEIKNNEQNRY